MLQRNEPAHAITLTNNALRHSHSLFHMVSGKAEKKSIVDIHVYPFFDETEILDEAPPFSLS